ncbi:MULTISPECIES: hypothetical protein [Nostoc]|uniref:Uncharacterized protein n=1 Tax=Nostoc paludosum FACHB-159 TaxID=2692908 RepID=A0ABR8KB83_9NOSO|nr:MULTISPECIES: hypothetical protein [Nostoc]MBD2680387.1 hypothetical protein [Nostoc sp. FACHB-857]MBD2736775.1 hypothetical protein [Nostoc paludosum FACHB-159]
MTNVKHWVKGLGIAVTGVIVISGNSAIAQIHQDDTLPNNFGIPTQESIRMIKGRTQSESNLPQSFKLFSVPTLSTLYCKSNTETENIINRLTDQNYSVSKDNILEFNYSIDPSEIQDKNTDGEKQVTDYLPLVIPANPIQLASCTCWSNIIHDFVTCPCR